MSVVSFARAAGVMAELSNSRSSIVSTSDVEADISMMSTIPCRTISRIWSRYSASERTFPVRASLPGAARPAAMSASFASARMKSFAPCGSAWMLASLVSSDFCIASLHLRVRLVELPGALDDAARLARPQLDLVSFQHAAFADERRDARAGAADAVFAAQLRADGQYLGLVERDGVYHLDDAQSDRPAGAALEADALGAALLRPFEQLALDSSVAVRQLYQRDAAGFCGRPNRDYAVAVLAEDEGFDLAGGKLRFLRN